MSTVVQTKERINAEPQTGWPRPRGAWLDEGRHAPRDARPESLPVPWVLARGEDGTVTWTVFHSQAHTAHTERLCQVCGEELGVVILLGLAEVAKVRQKTEEPRTSGPGCHPRCMALTMAFCPHFRDLPEGEIVAYLHRGPGPGYIVFDQGPEVEPTPEQIEEVYTATARIAPEATPLDASAVKYLARRDPLGAGIDDQPRSCDAAPVSAIS